MIFTQTSKTIRVMITPFRDGLQSSFGGKVRLNDYLPAMQAAAKAGFRHMEFGGGARYQAPYFYLGENPFETMQAMRDAVGSDVDLQILTRSVSGVTLTTQSIEGLGLQAKLMKQHGTTWDRNFDYMNDVENLVKTGKPIVDAGMHHQACIAIMGLPFKSDKVHTPEFYIDIGRRLLESDIQIDSLCLKDASGTTDPKTVYDTVKGLKKIMPPEMILWQHTHDTASTAVSWRVIPHVTQFDKADITDLEDFLKQNAGQVARAGGKLTLTPVLTRVLYRYYTLDIERPSTPHVEAWYERMAARPAYKEHVIAKNRKLP